MEYEYYNIENKDWNVDFTTAGILTEVLRHCSVSWPSGLERLV